MVVLGYILILIGVVLAVAGELRLLTLAYRTGGFWFAGCLLVPFCDVAFLVAHFKVANRPFAVATAGWLILGIGLWILDLG